MKIREEIENANHACSPPRLKCARWAIYIGIVVFVWVSSVSSLIAAGPVDFVFSVEKNGQNPFAREIWAEVVTPAKVTIKLPAFFVGDGRFSVRARADVKGEYRLGAITETVNGRPVALPASPLGTATKLVRLIEERPAVRIDPKSPSDFIFTSGERFVPIGANLPWATGPNRLDFYRKAFKAFAQAGLNWSRVWMAHWGGLNMEWLPADMGTSPPQGALDLRVAENWDRVLAMAEENGVYLQIVLQHHGQYSSKVNSNWNDNPWNLANGGFLASPTDFFSSARAGELTRMKFRYIIARWGYSPAVMSWELFNEAHWTDAMREAHAEAAVAQWHAQMAAYIRSVDHYGHLVTTSMENLQSPVYATMDYLQPHLYAPNMLAGVRSLNPALITPARPVFFGEVGDDHMMLSKEIKETGVDIVPPIWASLTGLCPLPAQTWQGTQLMETGRLGELGAVAKFIAATKLGQRDGLTPFSAVVECSERVPLTLVGGQFWQQRPAPVITVPLDGREALEFADIPRIYVGAKESLNAGFSGRATFHFDFQKPSTLTFHITDAGPASGAIRISIDGTASVEKTWPEQKSGASPYTDTIAIPISAGVHSVVVENPGSAGWFDLSRIDLGLDIPVLAATGRRGDDFITVWVWHRNGLFTPHATATAQGTLLLENVPPGTWQVTWWDSVNGTPGKPVTIKHAGGTLRLPAPPISRHAAVVLEREAGGT